MHSFENRRVTYSDFQHSKQCKYKEKYLSKFSNVHKRTNLSSGKSELQMFFPISGRHVGAHWDGHQHGVSILISINLCETLCQITRVRNTAQTLGLDRVLIYLSSIACKFLDFIHWMVFDFYFDGMTVKTGNSWQKIYMSAIFLFTTPY